MASPQFDTLNLTKDEWNTWNCYFEQWLLLSPFSSGEDAETKKQAAFCLYVGSSTFKFLFNLLFTVSYAMAYNVTPLT